MGSHHVPITIGENNQVTAVGRKQTEKEMEDQFKKVVQGLNTEDLKVLAKLVSLELEERNVIS